MRLTLIRHGEMMGDPYIRSERPVSDCLSERGISQAKATAEALKERPFDHALSSPYGRALQTAEIVVGSRGVPITIVPELHEWLPNFELEDAPGTTVEDTRARVKQLYAEETWKTELGEGRLEMSARVIPPFLKALAQLGMHHRMGGYVPAEGAEELSVVVFAHGGSLGVLFSYVLGVVPFPIGCCDFSLTGVAEINFIERKGIYYPRLRIGPLHEL